MWPREDARQVTGRGGSRRGELVGGGPAAAAGARALMIVRLDLINKRLGELLMHKEELRSLWG
jgi:hypothetical protein